MPRNGSGTSSVINTFVIDTIADPDTVNENFTDVADQLTNSLPRDGQAGMNAPLPLQNGSAAAPALTFTSDTDTGLYRMGANRIGVALGGAGVPLGVGPNYSEKSGNYTAVAADIGGVLRFTATATLSLDPAATLGSNWHVKVIADGGDVTIDPDASETIDGATTVVIPNGYSVFVICSGSAFFTDNALSSLSTLMKWRSRGIGELYFANTSIVGVDIPPSTTTDTVWIELTSGLTGSGGFNENKLTSENVSGSAPLVLASAVINFAGSPMNGQTVRLLNTEGRILRPSLSPGTLQDDALQGHIHGVSAGDVGLNVTAGAANVVRTSGLGLVTGGPNSDGVNGTPRTANETRMKNVGVKAYMRIA